ncbi:hypothetical protein I0C86_36985 [Plantactinospora sp. S1510]|uniref:Flp pilus-assembly TadG-like N-terminal domain-containing protein n=1 Tax=Plantactinospora alkalitolerans TaxID=2789879 RepID=A0ABS0H7N5_9ACTN|nr:hypothetical protein [Plantactinospora alkalitolerans]MBF9134486.1 hypothetical protein [Plantactinospora alkalitolerans]
MVALLLALGSTVFAWRAIDQAKDAKDIAIGRASLPGGGPATDAPATPTGPSTTDQGQTPGDPTTAPDDVPRSPGEPPELNERTVYEPKYEKQSLVLRARCSYDMYADLDEPRAAVNEVGYDLRYVMGCGNDAPSLRLGDGVRGSEAARPGMTPQECVDAIRTAPIAQEGRVPVRKATMICVTTNYAAARERGDVWRMVLVEIVAVANDGAVTIQATAWNIPG